jgi:PAS domain S-box-containing protein
MNDARVADSPASGFWRHIRGPMVTLAIAVISELLAHTPLRLSNPPAFFVLAVAFAAFDGGIRGGLVSSALALAYIVYFFAEPGGILHYADADLRRIVVWAFALPAMAFMVGILNRRAARLAAEASSVALRQAQLEKRERLVEAARASERLFRSLLDHANDAIEIIDPETGRFLDVNEKACAAHSYRREEYLALTVAEIDPEIAARSWEATRDELRDAGSLTLESTHRRKDGSAFPVEVNFSYVQLDRAYVLAIVRDISERRRGEAAIRLSEERFRNLIEGSIQGIAIHDENGKALFANQAFATIYGFDTPDQVLRLESLDELIPAEDLPRIRSYRKARFSGRPAPSIYEAKRLKRDGSTIWLDNSSRLIEWNGKPAIQAVIVDITEQKQGEEALRASQAALSQAQRLAHMVRYHWSITERRLKSWDPGYSELLGVSPVPGQPGIFTEPPFHPEDSDWIRKLYEGAEKDRRNVEIEYRIIHPDGQPRWIRELSEIVLDSEGRASAYVGTLQDITERKRTEENLRQSEQRFRSLADNLPGIVYRLIVQPDGEMRETYISAGVKKMLGVEPELFTSGRAKLIDYLHPEEKERRLALMRQANERGAPLTIESERFIGRDGEVRWWQVYASPRPLPDGSTQFDGIALDITEQRAIAQQLRKSQRLEAVGQLTSGISHDFNNLLGVIVGNLDLALERTDDSHLRELIQAANTSALHGADLTRRLLAFSRGQPLAPEAVDLNRILPQIAAMLRRTLGEQVTVDLRLRQQNLWLCIVDRSQIEDVILNLAINARDAMPTGGTLTIEVGNAHLDEFYSSEEPGVIPGDYVLLTVTDTGSGMAPEVLEHVFEPFFTTKGEHLGTGLGLSMVYGFVKQSRGHIKIYSEVGHGTTVKIYLPHAMPAGLSEPPAPPQQTDMPRGAETILVVDDNPGLREITVNQLANLGYTTLEADSAAGALDKLDRHADIRLVLSDVIMPGGMNGYELAGEARRRRPGLKMLLMSGYASQSMVNAPSEVEHPELITKPFRMRDLALKLRETLGKS